MKWNVSKIPTSAQIDDERKMTVNPMNSFDGDALSMRKRIFTPVLYGLFYLIILPTSMAAIPINSIWVWGVYDLVRHPTSAPALTMLFWIGLGNFGLASMWTLFLHYLGRFSMPARSLWHCCALLGGAAACVKCAVVAGGDSLFKLIFVWPVFGAGTFLILMVMSRMARADGP